MKNIANQNDLLNVAEVELVYKTNVNPSERPKITSPEDAVAIFRKYWNPDRIEHIEEVKILLLNRSNRVLGIASISKGGISGSVIDERIVLQYAIKSNASGVIIAHNHPSGTLEPSTADVEITRKLSNGLKTIGLNLLDHLIITVEHYRSLIDEV